MTERILTISNDRGGPIIAVDVHITRLPVFKLYLSQSDRQFQRLFLGDFFLLCLRVILELARRKRCTSAGR